MRRILLSLVVALAIGTILGCGGVKKPDDLPELYPVKIKIIQDGAPLEGATVILNDVTMQSRFTCGGVTDAKGTVAVKTDGKYPGAPQGNYKVTVSKAFIPAPMTETPPSDPEARKEYDAKVAELNAQQADLVDPVYKSVRSTPFELEVGTAALETEFDVGEAVNIPFSESNRSSSDR
ncbi:MAG: carboxypeptidase regulatory-like domain-containing protein [Thermoguttaceae bacterium]|nr:carboxypeptidase regulatory-like domain-containing protein [Thermoguttaceae bacterium]